MSIIRTKNLTKIFGKTTAISNINLNVKEGSITGFLGPNGAGKSTTMNILMGFTSASDGEAYIFGKKVSVDNPALHQHIGFLSSSTALDKTLTAGQELEYYGHLNGNYNQQQINTLAKKLGLNLRQKIGSLSTGNHQKVALIIALMGRPKLLILDEPTNGLDPLVQSQFNQIIKNLRKGGTTIFISSHILSEVSELCDNFIFIKNGRIIASLTKKELLAKSSETLSIASNPSVIALLKKHKIKYQVEPANLEKTFMNYYQEDKNA